MIPAFPILACLNQAVYIFTAQAFSHGDRPTRHIIPDKKVILPAKEAGCPLADMITVGKLRKKKEEYPDAAVVCYVNSSADVKAESDISCTSSNAIQVVRSVKNKRIIFIPDRNLGLYVQSQVPEKEIVVMDGFCPTHIRLTEDDVAKAKKKYPPIWLMKLILLSVLLLLPLKTGMSLQSKEI